MKPLLVTLLTPLLLAFPAFAQSGGDLLPTTSPADGLMKTLDEVEARTAISDLPYPITEPGSYYLTKDLVTSSTGIRILSSDVTINLNGFTIFKGASQIGIRAEGSLSTPLQNIQIQNGSFHKTRILLEGTSNSFLTHLSFTSPESVAIHLDGTSLKGPCKGNVISYCTVSGGISGLTFTGNNSGECSGNRIKHCQFTQVLTTGIYFLGSNSGKVLGNRISDCVLSHIAGWGMGFTGGSAAVLAGNIITRCSFLDTGTALRFEDGFNGNQVLHNDIQFSPLHGIRLIDSYANRLEGNFILGQGSSHALFTEGASSQNLILLNKSTGYPNNYSITPGNTMGPEITTSGVLPTTGVNAHPWANTSLY